MAVDATIDAAIDGIVDGFVSPDGPGLAVLIGRGDEVLLQKGYGLADVTRRKLIWPDTRFLIASLTKQFVGLAIQMLKHEGRLGYDEPIARFFPDFPPYKDEITMRDLLTHTSGLRDYLATEAYQEACRSGRTLSRSDAITMARDSGDLVFAPGTRWSYCNTGYLMLGAIIEQVSGQTCADFMRDRVFAPFGMTSTSVATSADRPVNMALGYVFKDKGEFSEAPYGLEIVGWEDGNVISTVGDMFRWGQAFDTDRLLPREVRAEAFVPCRPHDPAFSRYGFGLMVSERRGVRELHHSGRSLGYVARFSRFTDEDLTIVMLSNAFGLDDAEVMGALVEVCLGDRLAPVVEVPLPLEHLEEKVGLYLESLPTPGQPPAEVTVELRGTKGPEGGTAMGTGATSGVPFLTLSGPRTPPAPRRLVPLGRDYFRVDNRAEQYAQFLRTEEPHASPGPGVTGTGGRGPGSWPITGLRLQTNGLVQDCVKRRAGREGE